MKAAVLTGIGKVEIQERPVPEPARGEVRLRVRRVGVCGSDVHYYTHGAIGDAVCEWPHISGHEFAGVIDKLGEGVAGPPLGTRVAVDPHISCGRCELCEKGYPNICPDAVFPSSPPYQGAFTEYFCHPARLVFPVPDGLTDDDAAMLEPLGVGMHAARRSRVGIGDTVAVIGCGPIGLLTLQCARLAGARRIFAADLLDYRLEHAARLGAEAVFNPNDGDVVSWLNGLTNSRGVDVAIECAGDQPALDNCIDGVRVGGRVGLVGSPREDRVSFMIHTARRKELDLINVRRSRFTFEDGIEMATSGLVDLRSIVTHHLPLEELGKAFELVDKYADGVVKVMMHVSDP